jgi:prepilin-type N-terminal cleavage/methylation domain-containing protein
MNTLHKQAGVTLNELIISLSIVSILIGFSVPSFTEFISKRELAGAANLVSTFFEDVKMESVKQNAFATVNYQKADNGVDWCIGAIMGDGVSCDCMAETPQCLINSEPAVLSSADSGAFDELLAEFTDGSLTFDPVRGILKFPTSAVSMQFKHKSEDFLVNVSVNATGSVRKCSPSGAKLIGYPTCI